MHEEPFDQAVRGLPRRGFLGLAAGLTALALGRPSAEARRKKRKKCKKGTAKCGKKCSNLQTDSANCGACGVVCSSGRSCSGGVCTCPAGQSFVAGACIPRFGCTLELDTCVSKKSCPELTGETDDFCFVTAEGEPFCGTALECVPVPDSSACPTIGGKSRTLIPCSACQDPGDTGACVLPIIQPGSGI